MTIDGRKPFNIELDEEDRELLDKAAGRYKVSRAQVIRTAVRAYCEHAVAHRPTCAIGTPCLCPQIWSGGRERVAGSADTEGD